MPRLGTRALAELLEQRVASSDARAIQCLENASEIIVFGSMSVGLDRPGSDLDVLCIGDNCRYKLKSLLLDLIAEPSGVTTAEEWLQGELATHVAEYGTWIKGNPTWKHGARVGQAAIDAKSRRVAAFLRSLSRSWLRLEECFRYKYSLKVRRETQRLILLERGMAVPPTRVLDYAWFEACGTSAEVCDRLHQFVVKANRAFVNDLFAFAQVYGNRKASGVAAQVL